MQPVILSTISNKGQVTLPYTLEETIYITTLFSSPLKKKKNKGVKSQHTKSRWRLVANQTSEKVHTKSTLRLSPYVQTLDFLTQRTGHIETHSDLSLKKNMYVISYFDS